MRGSLVSLYTLLYTQCVFIWCSQRTRTSVATSIRCSLQGTRLLHYCINLAVPRGIEPLPTAWQAAILTAILWDQIWWMRLDLNQQCHYDGRFTVSWGYQFSYTSKTHSSSLSFCLAILCTVNECVTHSRYAFWPRQRRKENVCIKTLSGLCLFRRCQGAMRKCFNTL